MLTPAWFELGLLVTAGAAALEDLAERRIPNPLLGAALTSALLLQASGGSLATLAGGMLAGLLALLPFYWLGGMAAGDVKLLAVLGAFGGPALALSTAAVGLVLFGLAACVAVRAGLCLRGQAWPFAPALALASLLVLAHMPR
jgi:prepilin peptidase CpaA